MSEKPINAEEVYLNRLESDPGGFAGGFYEDRPNANYNVSVQPPTASDPSEEAVVLADLLADLRRFSVERRAASGYEDGLQRLLNRAIAFIEARASLTVSEEARDRAIDAVMLDNELLTVTGAERVVDTVLAVLLAGRSEGDGTNG